MYKNNYTKSIKVKAALLNRCMNIRIWLKKKIEKNYKQYSIEN